MADTYKTVLSDDFSTGYHAENWGNPYDGGEYWNNAWSWSAADVKVADGEMQVSMTHHDDGSWTGGGFNSEKVGNTITYGTIDFDARVEEAQGTMAAILTWPDSDNWPQDGEIDILETPYQTAMHTSHFAGAGGDHQYEAVFSDIDPTQQHHYTLTWLPDLMKVEVDGQTVAEWTDPAAIPDVAHGFGAMGFVGSGNDVWMGGAPDGSTPDKVTAYIDNVVLKQWMGDDGGAAPAQPAPAPDAPAHEAPPVDAPVVVAPAPPAAPSIPAPEAPPAAEAPAGSDAGGIDWDATSAAVQAHFDQFGDWGNLDDFLVHTGSEAAPIPSPEPVPELPAPEAPTPTPDAPAEQPQEPDAPAERGSLEGGAGKDTLQLDHAFHFDVDGGAGKDVISLGDDHGDIHILMNAGEGKGDLISGFDAGKGDLLVFHGYGEDAAVADLGQGVFKIADSEGNADRFTMLGVEHLSASDYVFG